MNRNAANQLVHRLQGRLRDRHPGPGALAGRRPSCEVLAAALTATGIARFSAEAVAVTERHVRVRRLRRAQPHAGAAGCLPRRHPVVAGTVRAQGQGRRRPGHQRRAHGWLDDGELGPGHPRRRRPPASHGAALDRRPAVGPTRRAGGGPTPGERGPGGRTVARRLLVAAVVGVVVLVGGGLLLQQALADDDPTAAVDQTTTTVATDVTTTSATSGDDPAVPPPSAPPTTAPVTSTTVAPLVIELLDLTPDTPQASPYQLASGPLLRWRVTGATQVDVWLLTYDDTGVPVRTRVISTAASGEQRVCPGNLDGGTCGATFNTYAFEIEASDAGGATVRTPPGARPVLTIVPS